MKSVRLHIEVLEDRTAPAVLVSGPTAPMYSLQNGVSPEYLAKLADELHSSTWLSMPHMAADDYVRSYGGGVPTVQPVSTAVALKLAEPLVQHS